MATRRNKPTKSWDSLLEVRFVLSSFAFGDSKRRVPTIDIWIDGRSLWEDLGGESAVDGVPGLTPQVVAAPSRHWRGQPDPQLQDDGRAVIFDCDCGHWPCGGVLARIEVGDDTVRWADVGFVSETESLRSFRFDRAQYEDALRGLTV